MIADIGSKRARIGSRENTTGGTPSIGKKTMRSSPSAAQQPANAASCAPADHDGAQDGAQDSGSARTSDDSPRPRSARDAKARDLMTLLQPGSPLPVVIAADPTKVSTCQGTLLYFGRLGY